MTEQQPSEWALNLVMEAFYACTHDVGNDWTCRDCQALQIDRVAQAVKEAAAKEADDHAADVSEAMCYGIPSAGKRIRQLDLSRIMGPRADEPTKEKA